ASGFWHGAAWTFIIWGIYHGVFLVLERAFLGKWLKAIGKIPATLITFILVAIGWVFFRSDTTHYALGFIGKLFQFNFSSLPSLLDKEIGFYFILAILFSFFTCFRFGERVQEKIYFSYFGAFGSLIMTIVCLMLFTISVASITSSDFNPFIYFRF
ncbi:MAG TPA: hypothetical protein VNX68_11005, partial [Nitrosopumilaceae archaeon]|nr:hypothetical protein [Nitrosopumilaceae archaeon]